MCQWWAVRTSNEGRGAERRQMLPFIDAWGWREGETFRRFWRGWDYMPDVWKPFILLPVFNPEGGVVGVVLSDFRFCFELFLKPQCQLEMLKLRCFCIKRKTPFSPAPVLHILYPKLLTKLLESCSQSLYTFPNSLKSSMEQIPASIVLQRHYFPLFHWLCKQQAAAGWLQAFSDTLRRKGFLTK